MDAKDLMDDDLTQRKVNRIKLLALIALFLGPVVLTWLYHWYKPLWRPATSVHGTLIEPVRALPDVLVFAPGTDPVEISTRRGRWVLLQFNVGKCGASCRQRMADLRQLTLSLGKDQNRLQRVFASDEVDLPDQASLREHPGLLYLDQPGKQVPKLAPMLEMSGVTQPVYLVDPLGNLMLYYTAGYDLKKMRKDIRRLFEASVND